jgi:hypothetical protein
MDSRRNFFEEILAGAGLAALLAESAAAQNSKPLAAGQIRTNDFWGSFYESSSSRGILKAPVVPGGKDVRYLFSDANGLRYVDQVKKEELLSHPGDAVVNLSLGQFRPGTDDARSVKELTSSQLRVDCVQTRPFMDLLAPAAWVAMASLYTDKIGKLPSLQQLGFQQPNLMSGENKIILPGGSGKFAVNVSSMSKESMLHKILRQGINVAGMVSPLISLPAMSIPAAMTFTAIYSLLEERASFIMSSGLVDAAATQQSLDRPGFPPQFIPLKTGDYVMIPKQHTDMLADFIPYLDINQGYLIDRRQKSNLPVDQQAPLTVPGVTYVTMKLTVAPITLPIPGTSSTPPAGADAAPAAASKSGTATKGGAGKKQ